MDAPLNENEDEVQQYISHNHTMDDERHVLDSRKGLSRPFTLLGKLNRCVLSISANNISNERKIA